MNANLEQLKTDESARQFMKVGGPMRASELVAILMDNPARFTDALVHYIVEIEICMFL